MLKFRPNKRRAAIEDRSEEQAGRLIFGLLLVTCALTLFGITMLYSTSYTMLVPANPSTAAPSAMYSTSDAMPVPATHSMAGPKFFIQQIIWAGAGIVMALAVILVGFRKICQYGWLFVVAALILLLVARYCFSPINGAYRWIKITKQIGFQPSEFAKIALAVFFAKYCASHLRFINNVWPKDMKTFKEGPFPGLLVCLALAGGVLLGKDLGTTVLMLIVVAIVLFCAGLRLRYILLPVITLAVGGFYLIKHYSPLRLARMTSFLDPEKYQQGEGYQLFNSFLAFGSGSWTGLGLSQSRLKTRYLPEAHTDFIMSIVGEELGFIAMLLVIAFYLAFVFIAIKISAASPTRQGMLLGIAIASTIGMQAIINIGVACGAFPTKGMPAPFISYGGSSMLVCMIFVGLLFSIAYETAHPNYNDDIYKWVKARLPFFNQTETK